MDDNINNNTSCNDVNDDISNNKIQVLVNNVNTSNYNISNNNNGNNNNNNNNDNIISGKNNINNNNNDNQKKMRLREEIMKNGGVKS